ncbi:hypothetical protein MHYMCMPSP_00587 [Hyalomma marginatum]|uniref:Uncharacterized protein n=1 Tax=Hyalomma marginatum TaxID=34627 RepID=A0A8S4BW70_9ACAR|nr:hypothetical protein MHYMCMPASI_00350 [Hyalomma marginatum]CAG7592025.1 hypothetical protein MHYMCMPSP_00587 [Hyalomma marginatum]
MFMEFDLYLKAFFSFIAIIALIICIGLIIKYVQATRMKKSQREISIQEILLVDNKNKIALIKRKKSKYILLLSENNNLLIDTINES